MNKVVLNYAHFCAKVNKDLHRYYTIDDKLLKSLSNNYVWFSDPQKFNDPFDYNLSFNFENNTAEEIDLLLNDLNNSLPENHHLKKRENDLPAIRKIWIENPKLLYQIAEAINNSMAENLGVCCFSERDDIVLMWSHYGNKHRGVCLSFDIEEDKSLFGEFSFAVEYPVTYPQFNAIKEKEADDYLKRLFLYATKSSEWSYEKEVRVIRNGGNPPHRGAVRFNKNALKGIRFGYQSTLDDRNLVKNVMDGAGGYEHVRFYLAKLKHLDFGIEYEEILKQ
jgi:hypothetical protein